MSASTVSQVLDAARTHLNDDMRINWPDQFLMPKLQEAHRELQLILVANGIPTVNATATVLTVPALTTDLTTVTGYPTDLIEPIWLKERAANQQMVDFMDMTERDFIPNFQQIPELVFWAWVGEKIILLGATTVREVQLRYRRKLVTPTLTTDTIGILLGELYLSYRTASLAMASSNQPTRAMELKKDAKENVGMIISTAVKEMQNLPAKRRPYHRRRGILRYY